MLDKVTSYSLIQNSNKMRVFFYKQARFFSHNDTCSSCIDFSDGQHSVRGKLYLELPFWEVFHIKCLRRSAANENLFKLFFLHPFLASTIHNNTFKTKSNIG